MICARIHLFSEVLDILVKRFGVRMSLGVTSACNVKVSPSLYVGNKVACVAELLYRCNIGVDVASESEDILDPAAFCLIESRIYLLLGKINAREVEHRYNAVFTDLGGNIECIAAVSAAACAECNADEVGVDIAQLLKCLVYHVN